MNPRTNLHIEVSRSFEQPAERVFDAWLDPAIARNFLFATTDGEMLIAETDPRVGGKYRFVERRGDEDAVHHGEYLVVDRPTKLVFTFAYGDNPSVTVTIDIVPTVEGCSLTLAHELDPDWAEYYDRTKTGWTSNLENLARSLS